MKRRRIFAAAQSQNWTTEFPPRAPLALQNKRVIYNLLFQAIFGELILNLWTGHSACIAISGALCVLVVTLVCLYQLNRLMPENSDTSRRLPLADGAARPTKTSPLLIEQTRPEDTGTGNDREPPKENGTMLDVHPAHHAASSWREFFIHIATIVVGLLIAVGLEQTVELIHHHRELKQIRQELTAERETNRIALTKNTKYWRWEAVQLENNLMVLAYLQHHPGTADEDLPGSLVWSYVHEPHSEAVWDAAKTSGVTSFMSREEIEQYEDMYNKLRQADDARLLAWSTLNDASRYQFTDSRLSDLTPAQIADVITLTQTAMNKHWLLGVALENMASKYKDFSPSITADELSQAHNRQNIADGVKKPAFAATIARMQAAGFGR